MKKKLTLLIFLLPYVVMAQLEYSHGNISYDFGKKKKQQEDTTQPKSPYASDEEEQSSPKKVKKQSAPKSTQQEEVPDFKKDGLFKGLINVGLNACQVDGDNEWGYKYLGFKGGVGAMVRFHKFLSMSLELNYSMKGAKARFREGPANDSTAYRYRVMWDYMEIPVSLNVHDKKLIMASIGLSPGLMIRYKEINYAGQNVTGSSHYGDPKRFDLCAFGGFYFVIFKHYLLGGDFSYSLIPIRPSDPGTRVVGQRNNVINVRFMVVLDKALFKKKK